MNIHSRRAAPESYNYTYVLTRIWILAINAPETRRLIRHVRAFDATRATTSPSPSMLECVRFEFE